MEKNQNSLRGEMSNPIIVFGSSRSLGETYKTLEVLTESKIPIIDLNTR